MLHFPYFDLYRKQVVKQADLVLAMQLCPEPSHLGEDSQFLVLRGAHRAHSSLSRARRQSSSRGWPTRARLRLLGESSLIDLDDAPTTRETACICIACGHVDALIAGFVAASIDGRLRFAPRLRRITRLRFTIRYREADPIESSPGRRPTSYSKAFQSD